MFFASGFPLSLGDSTKLWTKTKTHTFTFQSQQFSCFQGEFGFRVVQKLAFALSQFHIALVKLQRALHFWFLYILRLLGCSRTKEANTCTFFLEKHIQFTTLCIKCLFFKWITLAKRVMLQCSSGILAVFQRMSASSATRLQMQLHFNTLAIALSCFAQLVLLTVGWSEAGGRLYPHPPLTGTAHWFAITLPLQSLSVLMEYTLESRV